MSSKTQNIFTSYGEALSKVLDIKRFSQRELADKIGVNESQVSRWVNGSAKPYVKTQRKISSSLHFDIFEREDGWAIEKSPHSQDQTNEPRVVYADEVDLPKDGKLSRDQMKELLGQIESIARILKDSL